MKILVIEDDRRISSPVIENLSHQGHEVQLAENGSAAYELAISANPDLVLLDLMLPGLPGIELCQMLRAEGYEGFIVMLTARTSKEDKIFGLDAGADDYLPKPFDIDELNARIRSFERRTRKTGEDSISIGLLTLDLRLRQVRFDGEPITMTPTEMRILGHFMRNPDRIFSKNELIEQLWREDMPAPSVVKAHIRSLRQKLQRNGVPSDLIITVYGFGYRLNSHNAG